MIETVDFKPDEEYFAAANSYSGFVSRFPQEFDPIRYERMFILKGGPGTGKSTLMRGIGSRFANKEIKIKAIYCSSDIHSLDGIILEYNGKSICVIDGTAPHAIDPEYPGAKEEIINLAQGFNNMHLRKNSDTIIELNHTKKQHYKNAYSLLKIAGCINEKIIANYLKSYDYSRAEFIISELLANEKPEESRCVNWRYISCFNKGGLMRLSAQISNKRIIKISGNGYSEYLFMQQLVSHIKPHNITNLYYTPLTDKMIECISTPHFTVLVDKDNGTSLNTSNLVEPSAESVRLAEYKQGIENLAAESFTKASDSHFELEKIYTEATNFSHNEEVFGKLVDKIRLYLDLNI